MVSHSEKSQSRIVRNFVHLRERAEAVLKAWALDEAKEDIVKFTRASMRIAFLLGREFGTLKERKRWREAGYEKKRKK